MLKKDITFIYSDSAEKSFMLLLQDEAKKRGYKTTLTNDKFKKCEIGVYCQHVNFPEYSKFSIIMLHDITQQYGNWPDIWYREPWNKYDIGMLPSVQWLNNWNKCSQLYYARPKRGMYLVGWPKADGIANVNIKEYRKAFNKKYNLDVNKKTILYAPSWENDNKQDDFVRAVKDLNVNAIIKQWDANPKLFPEHVKNVNEMQKLHKNIDNVCVLPPSMNIFDAILASDILVSEESSTMGEAAMIGIPAISVSDWLIPDVTPSRFPKCNYDFVTKTKKKELKKCITNMLSDYEKYKNDTENYAKNNFLNIGQSCKIIMNIIDDFVNNDTIRYKKIDEQPLVKVPFFKNLKRKMLQLYNLMCYKWKVRNVVFRYIWNFLRLIKKFFVKIKNVITRR